MKISRALLGVSGVLALLAVLGCSGETISPVQPANLEAQVRHLQSRTSWIAPEAKNKDLLYVSDYESAEVTVYTYPGGKLVGTLTNFLQPAGECTDSKGDVFITDTALDDITEYAHGGTSPIATLSDPGERPFGCSYDATTGNLGVTNVATSHSSGQGSVGIYAHAKGTPKLYTDSSIYYYAYCGYDASGDLFADGLPYGSTGFQLAELAKGSGSLTNITIAQTIDFPGGVQWDGKYLAVGDRYEPYIYQFKIKGTTGLEESFTPLGSGVSGTFQFWIHGKEVILGAPNYQYEVFSFDYPTGGSAIGAVTNDVNFPLGLTLSLAASQ